MSDVSTLEKAVNIECNSPYLRYRAVIGSSLATNCNPSIFTEHEVAEIDLGFQASRYKCRLKNIKELALCITTPNAVQITELFELQLVIVSKMESSPENGLHTWNTSTNPAILAGKDVRSFAQTYSQSA
jgi:hypothetical protein